MAVMVNGGGAGGGGGWINITDSVTLGTGRQLVHKVFKEKSSSSSSSSTTYVNYWALDFEDCATGAYIRINNVQPGERYRVTAWRAIRMAYLDANDNIITGQYIPSQYGYYPEGGGNPPTTSVGQGEIFDSYGVGTETIIPDTHNNNGYTAVLNTYAPFIFAIPKRGDVKSVFISHHGVMVGSTYDDVIVEKYIG